ncbi:esterase-like activity of phytase family protein [Providencia stuartii]|uniref:Glycerophosphodiester phosphodiesterase n=2 Tax=Providencia TaxID=586 RepID=A0A1S1HTP6_PROST|nr:MULTISPECIES: esterase-like activity of phytase family protein [Providencia]ELR5299630.1 esterase-like activity of phytase family protein [Providencia stuartii]MDW7588599.1 esterase-like activity of phytase family protein [Providencia sp. 2023EL-00965]MDX4944802.1 esterase-like activity of phytase family protein [Providencia manganoxydans]OHT25724.1 glycerophosphodiester phosphodiesterase [Providencia stuartii]QQO63481.1 esterase-like activity of phytase family protein [Providencia manganox
MQPHRTIKLSSLSLLATLVAFSTTGYAQQEVPATLAGHAILAVDSTVPAPKDAPQDLHVSGKYTTGNRVDELGKVEGKSADRPTGMSVPINGQPLQGHSGIKRMADGTYWVLTDNGYGNKVNSPDSMLYLTQYDIDFKTGKANPLKTVFFHDPDKIIPFHIINESSDKRYLTGSDFDPESFQFADGALWVGEEFGPYLIKMDLDGKVLALFETEVDGKKVVSPDHYQVTTPGKPADKVSFQVNRSKGFEGMASSPDGSKLYPMLEGALWNEEKQDYENVAGKRAARILEFDVKNQQWTGRSWLYVFEDNQNAIGDFNMIDDTHGLIIERDNGEGTADKACAEGATDTTNCFNNLAKFKRVYRIEFSDKNQGTSVDKQAYIDLMNIKDPEGVAKKPLNNGVFTFPFFTIENVDVVDNEHIIVGNDNNYPFSSSREPNQADDNEFILLKVPALLNP